MSQEGYFTKGPINNMMLRKTGALSIGLFVIILFMIIDTYFVGQLGSNELAAISYTFPIMMIIFSIGVGVGMGTAANVSKALGEKNQILAKKYATHALFLGAIIITIISTIAIFTVEPVYKAFGAEGVVLDLIKEYIVIVYISIIFFIVPIVGNNAIRATGDMTTPAVLMGIAGVINGIFDWFLIFGHGPFPAMGIKGAAVASLIAWICVFIAGLYFLFRLGLIDTQFPKWREVKQSWIRNLYISIPAAGTQLLFPITNTILLFLIGLISSQAVAAYGVASRIESLLVLGSMAMAAVVVPYVGQNLGAKKFSRIEDGFKFAIYFNIVFNFILAIIVFLTATQIASIFTDDPKIIEYTVLYLSIVPISYGFFGVIKACASACNGLQKPLHATLILIIKTIVFTAPFAVIGMYFYGLFGIFMGITLSNFLGGFYGIMVVKKQLNRLPSN